MADVIDEDPKALAESDAMRRALLAALAAIEGIREPLDDLHGDADAEGSEVVRGDQPREAPSTT